MMQITMTISRSAAFLIALAILLVVPTVALAGSVFSDVDDGNVHIEGITFVKDSGVSIGCDVNNNYCPSDDVSREQMGTFMYRLSGNDPATAPSVNATLLDGVDSSGFLGATEAAADSDLLDGLDSAQILPIVFGQSDSGSGSLSGTGSEEINSRTFAVPGDGYLVISGTVTVDNDGTANSYGLNPIVDGFAALTPIAAARVTAAADGASAGEVFTLSYTVVVPIAQGIHTVSQTIGVNTGTPYTYNQQNLVIVFYPEAQGFINQN